MGLSVVQKTAATALDYLDPKMMEDQTVVGALMEALDLRTDFSREASERLHQVAESVHPPLEPANCHGNGIYVGAQAARPKPLSLNARGASADERIQQGDPFERDSGLVGRPKIPVRGKSRCEQQGPEGRPKAAGEPLVSAVDRTRALPLADSDCSKLAHR
jgi:hypothetical protein